MLGLMVTMAVLCAAEEAAPLRHGERIRIAAPLERTPTPVAVSGDLRMPLPDPRRKRVGIALVSAGAVALVGLAAAQAGPPWRWNNCYWIPKKDRDADKLLLPEGWEDERAGRCPYTTFADWAHPIAMIGTVGAATLVGIGVARFGEVTGAARARADVPPRRGTARLALGGALTAIGVFGVFASVLMPDSKSGACDSAACMRKLSVASSAGISVSAATAVLGAALLGHAIGERRATRRPGHIAYGLGGDLRTPQLTARARF